MVLVEVPVEVHPVTFFFLVSSVQVADKVGTNEPTEGGKNGQRRILDPKQTFKLIADTQNDLHGKICRYLTSLYASHAQLGLRAKVPWGGDWRGLEGTG